MALMTTTQTSFDQTQASHDKDGSLRQAIPYARGGWCGGCDPEEACREACRRLEDGEIIFFEQIPFAFPADDQDFLRKVRQTDARYHKNIAYRPLRDRVTGIAKAHRDSERIQTIMRSFSENAIAFTRDVLRPYANHLVVDYVSFRPLQELGRDVRQSARNDLLHVDNFPTRPTNGKRILRVFVNINPDEHRHWITGGPFHLIVPEWRHSLGVDELIAQATSRVHSIKYAFAKTVSSLGIKMVARPPYDEVMLRLHHAMKSSDDLQKQCGRDEWSIPPGSCWMVFTDSVPHAVRSGQYALEQTFMVKPEGMLDRSKAPAAVLEEIAGRKLTV